MPEQLFEQVAIGMFLQTRKGAQSDFGSAVYVLPGTYDLTLKSDVIDMLWP